MFADQRWAATLQAHEVFVYTMHYFDIKYDHTMLTGDANIISPYSVIQILK
jgi:hypothetical protein